MTPGDPWKQRPCPRSDHRTTYKQGFGQFPKASGGWHVAVSSLHEVVRVPCETVGDFGCGLGSERSAAGSGDWVGGQRP